jgi:hypothetical protein
MFAIINRLEAIPGYSHGTVVSVHQTEFDALMADLELHSASSSADETTNHVPLVVLPLAVDRRCGEHVRFSDLVDRGESPSRCRTPKCRYGRAH